jgi:GATA zinc finger
MAEGCGRGLDFARHFGSRAHQNHRSGPTLASLPSLQECDDMIKRNERVLTSLARIREFVVAQQHAEQQRSRDEPPVSKHPPEYGDDASIPPDKADRTAGGFAGADAKKRRGVSITRAMTGRYSYDSQRNAPPGRCHSCNRAETPEWRRGPDGARTLCNACGLRK